MATIEDFLKLEFKVAQIKEAKNHPNADRLFVLKIDLGGGDERQLVAGIRSTYTAEQLVGKRIVVIANLEPAVLRGEESQGMLLAASDENGPVIISPEKDVALGSRVK
ncbi:MAG: methionine--tRNA ligase subunit beta [Candidatus Omnitrophica bacterium]|nr:methionine--tRNA ligase subunit beta [Candidatus Omnitrophota bacterium]